MIAVVLLAAGQGVRMNSRKQKILHEVGGRPMVLHAFLAAAEVADLPPVLVVGPDESGVRALIGDRATYAVQPEPLGTGHATLMAADALRGRADRVVVTYGAVSYTHLDVYKRQGTRRWPPPAPVTPGRSAAMTAR